jgi:hypothetical protein
MTYGCELQSSYKENPDICQQKPLCVNKNSLIAYLLFLSEIVSEITSAVRPGLWEIEAFKGS